MKYLNEICESKRDETGRTRKGKTGERKLKWTRRREDEKGQGKAIREQKDNTTRKAKERNIFEKGNRKLGSQLDQRGREGAPESEGFGRKERSLRRVWMSSIRGRKVIGLMSKNGWM